MVVATPQTHLPSASGNYVKGKIQSLNELIPADSGWVLLEANGINNSGQIVGSGRIGGKTRAYLLSPLKK